VSMVSKGGCVWLVACGLARAGSVLRSWRELRVCMGAVGVPSR
jgi:hypothetical protein